MTPSEFIKANNLTLECTFVPHSASRNKDSEHLQINWKVKLSNGRQSISTDYSQGIGHLPNYSHGCRLSIYQDWVTEACQTGNWFKSKGSHDRALRTATRYPFFQGKLPAPAIEDIVHCLIMEASVLDYSGFEDWAESMGMDTDSIKAKAMFDSCIETALTLRHVFDLEEAQESFQDY